MYVAHLGDEVAEEGVLLYEVIDFHSRIGLGGDE